MTYSLSADVPSPYGPSWSHMQMQEDETLPFPKWNHYDSGKTRPIAWFASHCNSATKRELFVRKLRCQPTRESRRSRRRRRRMRR